MVRYSHGTEVQCLRREVLVQKRHDSLCDYERSDSGMQNDANRTLLTEEEKEKALKELFKAMTPRDRNGVIEPLATRDGMDREIMYPYWKLDEHGRGRAMVFLDEFLNGNIPDDLAYAPGYQKDPVPVDNPYYADSIVYSDPVLNLPYAEQHLIRTYHDINSKGLKVYLTGRGSEADVAANADAKVVNETSTHMIVRTAKGDVHLANFSIEAVEHRIVHRSAKPDDLEDEFELVVNTEAKTSHIVVASKNIDNIVSIIQRKMPMCTVSTEVQKADSLIVNHVRNQLVNLPERHHIMVTGFIKIGGSWVFAHDAAKPPADNIVFDTKKTIPANRSMLPKGAFQAIMEFLGISAKLMLMLPLVLMAHLSLMFNLFDAAGYVPRFLLFLCGRTGSMKTSVSLALYRIFTEQPTSPTANFKDTEVALEIKLGEGNGMVILVDDYRPPVTAVDGKSNLSKLEAIVRAVGDRIAKSRSNAELGKAKEFLPTSGVVITGEDLGGTQSSQNRMLIVPISKGDINGKLLKQFQDDPMLIATHMSYFLEHVGQNGDSVVEFIKTNFDRERSYFAQSLREPRVVDTAVTLMLTASILCAYGEIIGAVDKGIGVQLLAEWRNAILQACIHSEGISREQDPVAMYLQAFFDMWDRKEIEVACDIKTHDAGKHIGYANGEDLWLWHHDLFNRVCRYWQRSGVVFPLTEGKMNEHLDATGLIRVAYETRGNGTKKLYVCKSSLPNRSRMLVLNEALARQYLENNE